MREPREGIVWASSAVYFFFFFIFTVAYSTPENILIATPLLHVVMNTDRLLE